MDGDFKSQTSRVLQKRCERLYELNNQKEGQSTPGGGNRNEFMCQCIGYAPVDSALSPKSPKNLAQAAAVLGADPSELPSSPPTPRFQYPAIGTDDCSESWDDYLPSGDDDEDDLLSREGEIEVQCLGATGLKAKGWFGTDAYCKVMLHRGLITKMDPSESSGAVAMDEEQGDRDHADMNNDANPAWGADTGKNPPGVFKYVSDSAEGGSNLDTLRLAVYDRDRTKSEGAATLLGQVSMSMAALMGQRGLVDASVHETGEAEWHEFTLPLHVQYVEEEMGWRRGERGGGEGG